MKKKKKKKRAKVLTHKDIPKPKLTVYSSKNIFAGMPGAYSGIFLGGLARLERAKDTNGA